MLEAIIDTLVPFLPGYLELPASYVGLLKGATHKYIKRVPKAGGGYRYFYHVGHGGGVQMEDHFVPGASFQHEGGHYHIKSAEGGKLVIEHDETKERKTVSKAELRDMLGAHHEPAIKAHREKVAGMLAEAKANKASPKQIARLEARAKAAGAAPKAKGPPSKPKDGATRDEHIAAHMAASDHHEFESDQLINEAMNSEEDTGKRATALRKKAKEHDQAFTLHRNAMSSLRSAKSSEDAASARSDAEKAWAATDSLHASKASDAKGGGWAEAAAPKTKGKDKLKSSRADYKTKAHRASAATWEVEITTPDGKTKWERVGGERPIKDAAEASKIALDQFLGAETSPATSKREAKAKAPDKAKTEPKAEPSRPATLQQETERQYKRIWADYEALLSTASKSRAEQLRPQFEARARSMAEDRAKRLVQHRKDPRFHEEVAAEHAFNKKEGMNDYEAKHLAELTVMDRAAEQRGLRRER